ncbi:MAG: aminopeptidase N, partial [Alphaproteobacteria bacterium]|nr:aminopeptidase N [Alphaproteobacteria bacterium]
FNFGAMENKGLNIFNDRYVLADPETATDADYANIERVIAHEYFHNWTGNRITCRDWFQLCLKEGLTVYRDQEFSSDMRSRAVKRIEDVRTLRATQFPEDAGPLAHPARPDSFREIENFYTATVYEKGAEIVRMLATLYGDAGFRKGFETYFQKHDGTAATIEDWLGAFADAHDADLDHFLEWYRQAGTPEVTATGAYDAESRTYRLTLTQNTGPTPGQPEKQPMVLPVKFGLVGPNGQDLDYASATGAAIHGDLIVFDQPVADIEFTGVSAPPVPSLFRQFSAPVKLLTDLGDDDRLFLARSDSDPFNRWQALQDIALRLMVCGARAGGTLTEAGTTNRLAAAYGALIADKSLDDAYKALALTLPSEASVAQSLAENVDPEAVLKARRWLLTRLGEELFTPLVDAYFSLAARATPYSLDAASTQARSFRNQCLALIARADADPAMVSAHYRDADNMTDRMAALEIAVATAHPEADALVAAFHDAYAGNSLLLDKWLQLVSARPGPETLGRVRDVFNDPGFPRTNPNRVRALIGGFATGNPAQFARPDGEGFAFVASVCGDLDAVNPQLAARLLTAFRSFRLYEPERQKLATAALESLKAREMSRNMSDILTRILSQ